MTTFRAKVLSVNEYGGDHCVELTAEGRDWLFWRWSETLTVVGSATVYRCVKTGRDLNELYPGLAGYRAIDAVEAAVFLAKRAKQQAVQWRTVPKLRGRSP